MSGTPSPRDESLEDLKRQLKESKLQLENAKREAEEERRQKEEERRQKEEERRQKEEERRQKEEERRQKEDEQRQKEDEQRQKEDEQRQKEDEHARADAFQKQADESQKRADEFQKRITEFQKQLEPTQFLDYVRKIEAVLFMSLEIPEHTSSINSTTSVAGRYYPQHLQPWVDFPTLHNQTFDLFTSTFGNNAYFPSKVHVDAIGEDLSPLPVDEASIRPFIRASIEKPAARVVSKYMELTGNDQFKKLRFKDTMYWVQDEWQDGDVFGVPAQALETPEDSRVAEEPPRKRSKSPKKKQPAAAQQTPRRRAPRKQSRSPQKRQEQPQETENTKEAEGTSTEEQVGPIPDMGIPDRWLYAFNKGVRPLDALVGEYKAAHCLPATKVASVLSAPPGDTFFLRATGQDGASAANDVDGSVYVAKVLCQVFHYMITSGLEFGYVSSGDGLIFLRVFENDPNTLYYHWAVFAVDPDPQQAAHRSPIETATAHLATLCMCAVGATKRSPEWIAARRLDLRRWPKSVSKSVTKGLTLTLRDGGPGTSGRGGGMGGWSTGSPTKGGSSSRTSRAAGSASASGQDAKEPESTGQHQTRRYVAEPSLLPFCTQACLRGLHHGLPLDPDCPNTPLHRAAALAKDLDGRGGDRHALTSSEFAAQTQRQLAVNMDKDCESLCLWGLAGRYGALCKITVTGFGYTLVAKAVLSRSRHVLEREEAIYTSLRPFQGRLIPVCLGLVDLVRQFPLGNCQFASYMLLLSYVGPNLCYLDRQVPSPAPPPLVPEGVDLEQEQRRTQAELRQAGLWDEDSREANLAWNAETQRVMQFDFDQAYVETPEPVDETIADRRIESPSAERPPLTEKRNLNADNHSDLGGNGQRRKRARMGQAMPHNGLHSNDQ